MDDVPPRTVRLVKRAAQLPQQLLLSVVAAGVFTGLALGAASVWFSATFGAAKRDKPPAP